MRHLLSLELASGMDDPWLIQTVGAHQHTLQYLRWWFQAKIWIKICLKISYFLKKFVKIRQALEVPPPYPNWLPAAGGSVPRLPPPCDFTHTYFTATKRYKFVALFNEGFKGKSLVKTFFWRTHYIFGTFLENTFWTFGQILTVLQTVSFSYFYDSATSPGKNLSFFGENCLNLGKFGWICAKLR